MKIMCFLSGCGFKSIQLANLVKIISDAIH